MSGRKRKTAFLPPVPCTQEFRERTIRAAELQEISIAELQRRALEFFLDRYDRKLSKLSKETIKAANVIETAREKCS